MSEETVLTSRRALLRTAEGWQPGRLRISDRDVRFAPADGAVLIVPLGAVVAVRMERRVLVVDTGGEPLRLRCFAASAVAQLLPAGG